MDLNPFTPHAEVNALLETLLREMTTILGERLVGLYLYGSLRTGDFDPEISDIDLLAAVEDDLDAATFAALDAMHHRVLQAHPVWHNRLEIAYLSRRALQTFKHERSPIAVISPGEPFNIKDAGDDWTTNWYVVQTYGMRLYGSEATDIIAPVSQAEFMQAVRDHMLAWREYIEHVDTRPYQGYAILTMCRGLYTLRHGEQVSKLHAAAWVQQELPQEAAMIEQALDWRRRYREANVDSALTFDDTRRFVLSMIERIAAEG